MGVTSLTEPILKPNQRMSNAERSLKSELPQENSNVAGWNIGFGFRHSNFTWLSRPLQSPPKTARVSGETRADVSAVCNGKTFTKFSWLPEVSRHWNVS